MGGHTNGDEESPSEGAGRSSGHNSDRGSDDAARDSLPQGNAPLGDDGSNHRKAPLDPFRENKSTRAALGIDGSSSKVKSRSARRSVPRDEATTEDETLTQESTSPDGVALIRPVAADIEDIDAEIERLNALRLQKIKAVADYTSQRAATKLVIRTGLAGWLAENHPDASEVESLIIDKLIQSGRSKDSSHLARYVMEEKFELVFDAVREAVMRADLEHEWEGFDSMVIAVRAEAKRLGKPTKASLRIERNQAAPRSAVLMRGVKLANQIIVALARRPAVATSTEAE